MLLRFDRMLLDNVTKDDPEELGHGFLGVQDGRSAISKFVKQLHETQVIEGNLRCVKEGTFIILGIIMAEHVMELVCGGNPLHWKAKSFMSRTKSDSLACNAPMCELSLNVIGITRRGAFNVLRNKNGVTSRAKPYCNRR